jgi:N-acetylglucosamine malate deacetylase 2
MIDNATVGRSESDAGMLDALCSSDERTGLVPRITIVCAHPDDEVIGAGGRLLHLPDVHVVHVTDGAPRDMTDAIANGFTSRDAYARARAAERERALAIARIPAEHIHDIGLVDQEVSFALPALARRLVDILDTCRPELVLTHAYEGGHPDHDATALAVRAAVELARSHDGTAPLLVEFTGYHWRDGAMHTGCFLPGTTADVRRVSLGGEDRRRKAAMFACYTTQQRVLASFSTEAECFRLAPAYDFTAPPHEGRLFYEWFDWRVDGTEWRRLASAALEELGGATTRC